MSSTKATEEHLRTAPEQAALVLGALRAADASCLDALMRSGVAMAISGAASTGSSIVFTNEAFTRLTGYASDEALGRNCLFLQAANADQGAVAQIRRALEDGSDIGIDLLSRRKNGAPFWCRLHIAPLRDGAGAVQFFLSTLADVSSERDGEAMRGQLDACRRELDNLQEQLRIAKTVTSMTGAWEWDVGRDRLYGDARFASLIGIEPSAAAAGVPTHRFFRTIHPDDRLRVQIAVTGILNGAEVFAKDYRIVGADDTVSWVSARGRAQLDENDKLVRFSGVLSDITQQRRAEDRLRVAQNAGGVGTFEYLSGFGTAEVSEQFCRLLGLREAKSLPVRTINSVVHQGDPPIIDELSDRMTSFREFRIIRADTGETRWMARSGESSRDNGAELKFVGVIYDVTVAKLAEERLRELAETLEQRVLDRTRERDRVWALSQDLFNVCGFDGIQRAVNPAWKRVLDYDEAELVGSRLDALIHPDDLAAAAEHFAALTHMQTSRDFDCRVRHKNGSYRWIDWTAIPEGDVFYSIGRDITHRKQLEDLLRQSQKMEAVGQLTGGLAHDFNNMLMGIIGGLEIMRRRVGEGKTQDLGRLIEMALSSAERASALTHRLLAFSRRQSLDSRALAVNTLVISIEDLLRRTLGERIAIELDLTPDVWTALADSNQLESAILNLAINARDAMPEGGRLSIATSNARLTQDFTAPHPDLMPGDYIKIAVTDTGEGMPPQVVRRAFEPFYTTKPLGQGTGLGLSMVYGFAQQSKGYVTLESGVGHGTCVTLYLPRFDAVTAPETTELPVAAPRGDGETVLVIEDDETVRQLVVEVLTELGYTAIEARNGDEAILILKSDRRLDLMVSDVGLPGLNGRQIATVAREHRPSLRILFMTGYAADAADRPNFLGPGMDLILKPFSIEAIAVRVQAIIKPRG